MIVDHLCSYIDSMIKIILIIFLNLGLFACNNSISTQNQEKVINTDIKKQVSEKLDHKDQVILNEYNQLTVILTSEGGEKNLKKKWLNYYRK